MIPRVAHFVFGLEEQPEPFHFLHYASVESCRRVLEPEAIYFHHQHLPWGPWWERIRPHLTLVEVELAPEVLAADYRAGHVPGAYRYAHHSDFIRLDALLASGGVYADIDTIFVRPFPRELFTAPFVIGREPAVRDERSGEVRPSLCNALLMSEPAAHFARAWRDEMGAALNGTWSNHSGFLSETLSRRLPESVRVEPESTFFSFPASREGLSALLEENSAVAPDACSIHLWAHLWWDRRRRDFSAAHADRYQPSFVRSAHTTLAHLTRPYLLDAANGESVKRPAAPPGGGSLPREGGSLPREGGSLPREGGSNSFHPSEVFRPAPGLEVWSYLSLDEDSGYGVAARRCIAALEQSGLAVSWMPFVPGPGWRLGYQPAPGADELRDRVIVAHLVAEYVPRVRARSPDAFIVAHTVWDTTRIPSHWISCLNDADLIIVPSRFSADAIDSSVVVAPVAIVPHVAPPPATSPGALEWLEIPDDLLVFYTIAEWSERKAPFLTIEAYLRAFSGRDPVLLIVKTSHVDRRARGIATSSAAGGGTSALALARLLARHADPAAVRLITRELAEHEIEALHRRGDCYVSLARSEGWGLGAFDAAATGTPVVTTGFGGQLDYLGDWAFLVDFELVSVEDPAGFPSYAPDQSWAEPDVDHAASLLRQIAADRRAAAALAQPLAATINRRYSPSTVAGEFRRVVERYEFGPQNG